MIMQLLYELFPEGISEETAYHLAHFFEELSLELESHYFAQIKRYLDSQQTDPASIYPQNDDDDDDDDGSMPF